MLIGVNERKLLVSGTKHSTDDNESLFVPEPEEPPTNTAQVFPRMLTDTQAHCLRIGRLPVQYVHWGACMSIALDDDLCMDGSQIQTMLYPRIRKILGRGSSHGVDSRFLSSLVQKCGKFIPTKFI
mmetsp:Transcript_23407/g.35964  ORF Transcript_23407/g.35964 Transcript_23407/m.35964 type:complete len:126 (-) Transcript_23407:386-763(-)